MTGIVDEVPELEYRYTCVEGDAKRFTREATRLWIRGRGLWIVMALETAAFMAISLGMGNWWMMLGVPVLFLFFGTVTWFRTLRAHRRIAASGNVMSAGFGQSAFRLVDDGVQLTVNYARIERAERRPECFFVKLKKGRGILIPLENVPAEAEAKIRAGMAAAQPAR
ncbi:MAG: YcxB family protein [Gordonia sp. (in: high G+C Gram-positive bacteria)]